MMLNEVLRVLDVLDAPAASGEDVASLIRDVNPNVDVSLETINGVQGSTDFVKVVIPGKNGKTRGGSARTLGVIGRLGGIGARPEVVGMVSDGDGAASALSAALKLADMHAKGDLLDGDVIVATHVCPNAPTIPHEPVTFMGSPVDMETMNRHEVDEAMDAVLSIDTTRGNRVVSHKGIAITPSIREGWILHVSQSLLSIMERVTGVPPVVLAVAAGDITPYGNDVYHINSLLQPATATSAPVVGLAITSATLVAGSATGASHEGDIALAATFAVEAAKDFGRGRAEFHNEDEFERLVKLYGDMRHLKTLGSAS